MRKPKTAGEVAVMEVAQSSFAGVRTRAKTLALQRLQKSQPQPSSQQQSPASSGSYLQLRNRRLEKPPILIHTHCSKRQRQAPKVARLQNPKSIPNTRASSRLRVGSLASVSNRSVSNDGQTAEDDCKLLDNKQEGMHEADADVDVEVDASSVFPALAHHGSNYKTKLCENFTKGSCTFGPSSSSGQLPLPASRSHLQVIAQSPKSSNLVDERSCQ